MSVPLRGGGGISKTKGFGRDLVGTLGGLGGENL